jgi:hypothetical protein
VKKAFAAFSTQHTPKGERRRREPDLVSQIRHILRRKGCYN